MAKEQRGKTTPGKKSTVMEKESESLVISSSDDEAPEEVAFADSKAEALRSMKQAVDTARREKELLKEKRRKRQELFQEQKKRKLLPADILEEIDSAVSKKQKPSEDEAEEEEEEEEGDDESGTKRKGNQQSRIINDSCTVTTLKAPGAACVQQQAAQDFIQSRLYGPGSRRTTCNELLSLQSKTGRNKSAAVQFVKKDWACEQKAKAERLKKRWIQRQQTSSS